MSTLSKCAVETAKNENSVELGENVKIRTFGFLESILGEIEFTHSFGGTLKSGVYEVQIAGIESRCVAYINEVAKDKFVGFVMLVEDNPFVEKDLIAADNLHNTTYWEVRGFHIPSEVAV